MGALLDIKTKSYEQGRLTFTLSPKYIVVRTSYQTFFLLPRQSYWHNRLNRVRAMIECGEIQDLNRLAEFCGAGIELRATSLSVDALIYTRSSNE